MDKDIELFLKIFPSFSKNIISYINSQKNIDIEKIRKIINSHIDNIKTAANR